MFSLLTFNSIKHWILNYEDNINAVIFLGRFFLKNWRGVRLSKVIIGPKTSLYASSSSPMSHRLLFLKVKFRNIYSFMEHHGQISLIDQK